MQYSVGGVPIDWSDMIVPPVDVRSAAGQSGHLEHLSPRSATSPRIRTMPTSFVLYLPSAFLGPPWLYSFLTPPSVMHTIGFCRLPQASWISSPGGYQLFTVHVHPPSLVECLIRVVQHCFHLLLLLLLRRHGRGSPRRSPSPFVRPDIPSPPLSPIGSPEPQSQQQGTVYFPGLLPTRKQGFEFPFLMQQGYGVFGVGRCVALLTSDGGPWVCAALQGSTPGEDCQDVRGSHHSYSLLSAVSRAGLSPLRRRLQFGVGV